MEWEHQSVYIKQIWKKGIGFKDNDTNIQKINESREMQRTEAKQADSVKFN